MNEVKVEYLTYIHPNRASPKMYKSVMVPEGYCHNAGTLKDYVVMVTGDTVLSISDKYIIDKHQYYDNTDHIRIPVGTRIAIVLALLGIVAIISLL